jgi:hypothetical protein
LLELLDELPEVPELPLFDELLEEPLEELNPGGHVIISEWPSEYVALHSFGLVSALRPTFEPQLAALALQDWPPRCPIGVVDTVDATGSWARAAAGSASNDARTRTALDETNLRDITPPEHCCRFDEERDELSRGHSHCARVEQLVSNL